MVVDTSVLLAIFFNEPHARWAIEKLELYAQELLMSTVNLAETIILLRDRKPVGYGKYESELLGCNIHFFPPDIMQAQLAAMARIKFHINLGDCFVYALAALEKVPILTLDADFKKVDLPVIYPR